MLLTLVRPGWTVPLKALSGQVWIRYQCSLYNFKTCIFNCVYINKLTCAFLAGYHMGIVKIRK